MLYTLEQGPVEQTIIKQCLWERKALPPKIRDAPQLAPGLALFWDAFWELHTCRVQDGLIPWTAVDAYARRYALDGAVFPDLLYCVRRMDVAWSEYQAKQRKKKEPKKRGKAVRKSR